MKTIPSIVLTYLQHYAPKGNLIGYWLTKDREYNVLVLYQRDGEFWFDLAAFPEIVGHWGHQLSGRDYSLKDIKSSIDSGFCGADEQTKERLRILINRIENGLDIEEILAVCQKACDPSGALEPHKPRLTLRGPSLTSDGQYRNISALVNALADENSEIAVQSAQKLAAMGITEDDGPLFARDALLSFRKRQTKANRLIQTAPAVPIFSDSAKREEIGIPPKPPSPNITELKEEGIQSQPMRAALAYVLMLLGCPALVLALGVVYGAALTAGKFDYLWAFFIACGIWGFFVGVVKLCRFKHPRIVFIFAILTALGVLLWGHYVDYDWQAKDALYQRVQYNVIPRGRWVPGTHKYRVFQPDELAQYPQEWKKLNRDELYVQYLRWTLQDERAGGFFDHLRVRAKEGVVTPRFGKWPTSFRAGFWVWWAWAVHAFLFFAAALLSAAASFMERDKRENLSKLLRN